jgi:hypothetical protein
MPATRLTETWIYQYFPEARGLAAGAALTRR